MNEFIANLKREAEANPTLTLGIIAGLLTAAGKFVDSAGRYRGSNAYAKDVERRLRAEKRK